MNETYLKKVPGIGVGLFVRRKVYEGQVFCTANCIVYDEPLNDKLLISEYEFLWGSKLAIVFGNISFANHSNTPNVELVKDFENKTLSFRAIVDIPADEELRFKYANVWFDVK